MDGARTRPRSRRGSRLRRRIPTIPTCSRASVMRRRPQPARPCRRAAPRAARSSTRVRCAGWGRYLLSVPAPCAPATAASRGEAIRSRRDAELDTEAADEVRQIREADVESDVRDRSPARCEPLRGVAQARAQQPLVRRDSRDGLERAQEMIPAETRAAGELAERLRLARSRL